MNLIGFKKQQEANYIAHDISHSELIERATRRMGNSFIEIGYSAWRKTLTPKLAFKKIYSGYRANKRINMVWLSRCV